MLIHALETLKKRPSLIKEKPVEFLPGGISPAFSVDF
jgi:hypothetical protein